MIFWSLATLTAVMSPLQTERHKRDNANFPFFGTKATLALNLPNSTDHWTQFYSCSMINHWPLVSETQVQLALHFARPVKEEPTPATKVFCLVFQDILPQFCNGTHSCISCK
jgi:hypothetical protein